MEGQWRSKSLFNTVSESAAVMRPPMRIRQTILFVVRRGPIRWLVLCGILLIAMIAGGTAIMVGSFRDRAILNNNRELENTLLLLARHFDQQIEDGQVIQKDVLAYIKAARIETRSSSRVKCRAPTFT